MVTSSLQTAKIFEVRADRMDGGLNLNTDRLLKPEQISYGEGLRFERGSGLMTGPGYRSVATPVASASGGGLYEATITAYTLWGKFGTKIQYSFDAVTFWDTGVTLTDTGIQAFAEGPDGDIFSSNQTDNSIRFAVGTLAADAAFGDTKLKVGSIYQTKFTYPSGSVLVRGNTISYTHAYTANAGTDTFTANGHGLANDQIIQLYGGTSATPPAGITANTNYYIVNATANTFQLSSTQGGAAIDLTDTGSGSQYFVTTDGYLHVVTGIQAGGHPAGELVVQSSNPSTLSYKGNILSIYQETGGGKGGAMLLMSGMLSNPTMVVWGGPFTFGHPEYFYDQTSSHGGGFDFMSSKVMQILIGSTYGYVLQDKAITKITGINTTTGALDFQVINKQYGVYGPNCAVDMDGVMCFMGKKRVMPISLTLTSTGASVPQFDETFDRPLRPWLDSHDGEDTQQKAFLKWDPSQKILKIGASVNGALQVQGYDRHIGQYYGKEQRQVGASVIFKGQSYFLHTDNGKLYQDDIGRTADGITMTHIMSTGRIEYDRGRRYLKGKSFRHDGWMTRGTTFTLNIYINGDSTPLYTQDFDDSLIISNTGRSIGLRGIGVSMPGGSSDEGVTVYQFSNPILLHGLNGEDFRFEWVIASDGGYLLNNIWYFSASVPPRNPRTSN